MTGTHYNAAGAALANGGQANFYINCNFSLRTSTGILIVYEIGFPGRREVRSDLLPDLLYLYRNVKAHTSFVKIFCCS